MGKYREMFNEFVEKLTKSAGYLYNQAQREVDLHRPLIKDVAADMNQKLIVGTEEAVKAFAFVAKDIRDVAKDIRDVGAYVGKNGLDLVFSVAGNALKTTFSFAKNAGLGVLGIVVGVGVYDAVTQPNPENETTMGRTAKYVYKGVADTYRSLRDDTYSIDPLLEYEFENAKSNLEDARIQNDIARMNFMSDSIRQETYRISLQVAVKRDSLTKEFYKKNPNLVPQEPPVNPAAPTGAQVPKNNLGKSLGCEI